VDLDGGKARGRCACCALVVVSVPFFCSIHPYLLVTPRHQLSPKSDVLSSLCPNTYLGGTSATSFFSSASTYTYLQIERLRFMTCALISALLPPTSIGTRCSIQALLLLFFPVQRLVLLTSSSQHSLSPRSRKRYFHHTSLQIASPVCNPLGPHSFTHMSSTQHTSISLPLLQITIVNQPH